MADETAEVKLDRGTSGPALVDGHMLDAATETEGRNARALAESGGFAVLTELIRHFARHRGIG